MEEDLSCAMAAYFHEASSPQKLNTPQQNTPSSGIVDFSHAPATSTQTAAVSQASHTSTDGMYSASSTTLAPMQLSVNYTGPHNSSEATTNNGSLQSLNTKPDLLTVSTPQYSTTSESRRTSSKSYSSKSKKNSGQEPELYIENLPSNVTLEDIKAFFHPIRVTNFIAGKGTGFVHVR